MKGQVMENFQKTLARIEKMLAQVVGVQKMTMMEPTAFIQYAHAEVAKAMAEPSPQSQVRISLLYKSVLYATTIAKDLGSIEDADSEGIKVPVFVIDQTTFAEQSNQMYTPAAASGTNPSGQSVFEQGFIAKKIDELQATIADLVKLDGFEKADDEEDEEKADDEEEKKAKPKTEKSSRATDDKKRVGKAAAGKGETLWPDDLNDASFVKKGTETPPDWGHDDDAK